MKCRKIAGLLLTNFVERGEVQPRRFATGALNALRTQPWQNRPEANWNDLYSLVRNLALTSLDEEISADDVQRVMPQEEQGAGQELASLIPLARSATCAKRVMPSRNCISNTTCGSRAAT